MKRARLDHPSDPITNTTMNPFTFILKSKLTGESRRKPTRHTVQVTLSIPSDQEECPLTLESIAESQLPCLPDTPFLQDRPLHSKLTLPCGHSFSAMTLIYSFCKNNMTCPCCRAGREIQADTGCLPLHFKSQIKAHIQRTLENERRLDDAREHQEILETVGVNLLSIPYSTMENNILLVANFYDIQNIHSSIRPILSFNTILQPSRESGRMVMVPRGPMRAWAHTAYMGMNSVQLSIQFSMGGIQLVLDSSPITRLPDVNDINNTNNINNINNTNSINPIPINPIPINPIPINPINPINPPNTQPLILTIQGGVVDGVATSSFSMRFSRPGAHLMLDTISWDPNTENLEIN